MMGMLVRAAFDQLPDNEEAPYGVLETLEEALMVH
jgi:hypothetical protein